MVSRFRGVLEAIPLEFRDALNRTEKVRAVPNDVAIIAPTATEPVTELATNRTGERVQKTVEYDTTEVALGGQKTVTDFGGGTANVTHDLTATPTTPSAGLMVVDAKIEQIGRGLHVRDEVIVQGSAWPILQGTKYLEEFQEVFNYTRQVVPAGTLGTSDATQFTEIQPLDKWRSLQIASRVPDASDLAALYRVYNTVVNHVFPDTLLSAQLNVAYAASGSAVAWDAALDYTLLEGYRGPCVTQVMVSYHLGPPPFFNDIPNRFLPRGHQFTAYFAVGASERAFARAQQFRVPTSLHAAMTFTCSPGTVSNGSMPATDPVALPASGTYITVAVNVEKMRFNIFRREIIQVKVP